MLDPIPLLQAILVGATVAGVLTLSAVLFGVVAIAARGGVHHIEDFPRPGVSKRAEDLQVRLRHRYLLRQDAVHVDRRQLHYTPEPFVQPEPLIEPVAVPAAVAPGAGPNAEPAVLEFERPEPVTARRGRHALVPPIAPSATTGGFTVTLSRRQRRTRAGRERTRSERTATERRTGARSSR